jgi:hypothetical protein
MSGAGDVIVGEVRKNSREVIRVTVGNYKGHHLCHARVWVAAKSGPEMIPTRSGLSVRVAVLPDLVNLLKKVVDAPEMMNAMAANEGAIE